MTIRAILAPVRGHGKGPGLLDHALAVARRFNAHLTVVHCRPRPQDMLPYGVYVPKTFREQVTSWATGLADDEEVRLKALFEDYCRRHDLAVVANSAAGPKDRVSASWHEATGKQAAVVAVRGRLADLVAVAQPDRDLDLGRNTMEMALLETGRLVLLCPPTEVVSIGRHVAIGWDGQAEAARAVAAAMPILVAADQITVISADTGAPVQLSPEDLRVYLARHDGRADIRTFRSRATEVAEGLLATAAEVGADVLVIGAYGHSRRRELLMGGVTQHIIEHTRVPVLMVH
jgi:nucleotide-binding universal stress UspA family protein